MQDLIAAIGILYFERRIISVLVVYALSYKILYIAREIIISESKAFLQVLYNSSSMALALALCAYVLRCIAVHRAWQLVSGDKERYDVMWQSMMQVVEYQDRIAEICNEVMQNNHPQIIFAYWSAPLELLNSSE